MTTVEEPVSLHISEYSQDIKQKPNCSETVEMGTLRLTGKVWFSLWSERKLT